MSVNGEYGLINAVLNRLKNLAASWVTSGRFPVDRLPAMTDEKIWKGTGANVEEVDVYTDAAGVSAVEAAGLALASGKNIKVTSILADNDTWSGLTTILTAGEILALGEIVQVLAADSEVYKADADAVATMPAIAMATCATTDGNPFEFLLIGFIRHDAWGWTPGSLLYADEGTGGTPGGMTHAQPAGAGDQVQVVGIAITADIIYFNPSLELVEIS